MLECRTIIPPFHYSNLACHNQPSKENTLLGLVLLAACMSAAPGKLQVERVFGPEVPTGPYKHPASITELANGDLYLVYYGGSGEYAINTGVFGARLKKGSR